MEFGVRQKVKTFVITNFFWFFNSLQHVSLRYYIYFPQTFALKNFFSEQRFSIYRSFLSLPLFCGVVFSTLSAVARSLVLHVDIVKPLGLSWNKQCCCTAKFESYRQFTVDYPDPDRTESQNNLSTRIDVAFRLFISSSEQMTSGKLYCPVLA